MSELQARYEVEARRSLLDRVCFDVGLPEIRALFITFGVALTAVLVISGITVTLDVRGEYSYPTRVLLGAGCLIALVGLTLLVMSTVRSLNHMTKEAE